MHGQGNKAGAFFFRPYTAHELILLFCFAHILALFGQNSDTSFILILKTIVC